MALLKVNDLCVTFGGNRALGGLNLEVRASQIVGLIGPNGAGKTTAIDATTGFVRYQGGVVLDGQDLAGLGPHKRARQGLARTWQAADLFDDLDILANLEVASRQPKVSELLTSFIAPRRRRNRDHLEAALERVGLSGFGKSRPGSLSHGQQKLVGVARALVSEPKVLLLDEPAAGLDEAETVLLGERLRTLVGQASGMLLVDHDMSLVLGTCDYIYVLDFGQLIAEGTPSEIRSNPAVIEAYLGSEAHDDQTGLSSETVKVATS